MRLQALGGLRLEESRFSRPKPLLLLAFLALEGPTSRREVADLFWPHAKDRRDSLSSTLRRLKNVEPQMTTSGDKLGTTVPCDAKEFLSALQTGDEAQAVELYGGAFIEGLDISLGEELEEWVYTTREKLAYGVQQLYFRRAEHHLEAHDFEEAERWALQALHTSGAPPPDEATLTRLAHLLEKGNSLELRKVLSEAEALGLTLHPTAVPKGTPSSLPAVTTSFVGRREELGEIETLLGTPHVRLVTLHGPGGVGKSRLATEAARRTLDTLGFPGGVFFVPLETVETPEAVPAAVAEAMGVTLAPQHPPLESLVEVLGHKHVLLVLDNYEHLADRSALPGTLVQRCPNLRVLVTSRVRLQSEDEHVLPVGGLATDEGRTGDAVRLFRERSQKQHPDWRMPDDNLGTLHDLCALVDGAPLALELAATWTRVLSLPDILTEVEKDLTFLAAPGAGVPERRRGLRATFEVSWRLLGEAEREALRRLSVFRGGFQRDAALDVAGVSLPTLTRLLDWALITRTEAGRYQRHPLIRQFTEEKLGERADEARRVRQRHSTYFLQRAAREGGDGIGSTRLAAAWRWFDVELANLRAAWRWALDEEESSVPEDLLSDVAWYLAHYGEQRACYREVHAFLSDAVSSGEDSTYRRLRGEALGNRSFINFRLGDVTASFADTDRALSLLEGLGDAVVFRGRWAAVEGAIAASMIVGDFTAALAHADRAAEVAREGGRLAREPLRRKDADVALGICLEAKAIMLIHVGRYEEATPLLTESRSLLESHKSGYLAYVLHNLGQVHLYQGAPRHAVPVLQEALDLAQKAGFDTQVPVILCELARAHLSLGNAREAELFCKEGLASTAQSGDRYTQVSLLSVFGRVLQTQNKTEEASNAYRRSAALALEIGADVHAAEALLGLCRQHLQDGRRVEAKDVLYSICQAPGVPAFLKKRAEADFAALPDTWSEPVSDLSEQLRKLATMPDTWTDGSA